MRLEIYWPLDMLSNDNPGLLDPPRIPCLFGPQSNGKSLTSSPFNSRPHGGWLKEIYRTTQRNTGVSTRIIIFTSASHGATSWRTRCLVYRQANLSRCDHLFPSVMKPYFPSTNLSLSSRQPTLQRQTLWYRNPSRGQRIQSFGKHPHFDWPSQRAKPGILLCWLSWPANCRPSSFLLEGFHQRAAC